MAGEPILFRTGSNSQSQELGEVENRQCLSDCTPHLQVEMTHGAGGNNAFRTCMRSPGKDLVHQRSDQVRPGYRQKSTAAFHGMGPDQRFGPQLAHDLLHHPVHGGLLVHARRIGQHASVIGHKAQAVESLLRLSQKGWDILFSQKTEKGDQIQAGIEVCIPLPFKSLPGRIVLVQDMEGVLEALEAAGAGNEHLLIAVHQGQVPAGQFKGQFGIDGVGRGSPAAVPIRNFMELIADFQAE